MKITGVETFLTRPNTARSGWIGGKNWLLVKVKTDAGIEGWGEAYTLPDRDKNIAQHIVELSRYIAGMNPFHIKRFVCMAYDDFAGRRGAMDLFCAVSSIEQALWDIVGKSLGTPVYNLLGGPCRDRIRVYANGWYAGARTPEELARMAAETVKSGFTALKFDPFPGPWRLFISQADEKAAAENMRAVRYAVGPDIDILVEVHRRLAPMHAIRVARMIQEFNPFWYEESVPSDNLDAMVEVRRATGLPVVTGETLYTKNAFREVLEKRAADILNPDVASCGGILELKEIAAMAEPHYVGVAPHNYNSTTVALASTIQVAATIPNFLITEYFVNFAEPGDAISVNPLRVEGGYIKIPTGPGLGLEIDEDALWRYPYQESPPRSLGSHEDHSP
ncbi:MAG: mandelate racemase/muconate lactonizing enzyme family protein [Deltaproteobacteria bacterium]|nr:mandelate racemase/muconate lactonizing enzyme family protein [Deltaproteobacteria bacterium]